MTLSRSLKRMKKNLSFGIPVQPISRRTLLRGAGVVVALPALECMAPLTAAPGQAEALRMVAINFELSFHPPNMIPDAAGPDYALSPYLQPLEDLRNEFTFISGTSNPNVGGGHAASKSWLTGAPYPDAANFKNTVSIDQLAAKHIGRKTRFAYAAMGSGISISSNGVRVPGNPFAHRHFEAMFVESKPREKATQIERLREGRSVLDVVRESARRMQRRVSQRDRDKLEEYFTSVRDAEKNMQKSEHWQNKPKPQVEAKPPGRQLDRNLIIQRSKQWYDLIHLALQTDSTRLITYPINDGVAVPTLPGVSMNYHNLSHHGKDPQKIKQLSLVEAAQVRLFGEFLRKLKNTQEDGSNLLDRTQVLLGSHMHSGDHNTRNLPILHAGGGFHHGQHLKFDHENNTPLCNLYVSMLNRLGINIDSFGSSTGRLKGFVQG